MIVTYELTALRSRHWSCVGGGDLGVVGGGGRARGGAGHHGDVLHGGLATVVHQAGGTAAGLEN